MADENEDKTSKNEDEEFDDDLQNAFGDDEEDEDESDAEDDEEKDKDKSKDKDKDKDKDKKSDKKSSSAIHQKQKFRDKLKKANERIKELEGKKSDGTITDEERKEQQANQFLAKKIKEVMQEIDSEKAKAEEDLEAEIEDELEDVLEDNTDITEQQVLDVCEELEVRPRQAVKIIKREMALKGKQKPKVPTPKRGSPEVDDEDSKKKADKPLTFSDAARNIKDRIKKGLL